MNKKFLKMQKLAGLITESQYKNKLKENQSNDYSQYFQDIDNIIKNTPYPVTDMESLKDEMKYTDLVMSVAEKTGLGNSNDHTEAQNALLAWGKNKYNEDFDLTA